MSSIAGIGGHPTSVHQTRPTSPVVANAATADDTSNSAASSSAAPASSGSATNPLAPNVLSQLLNAQADASSPSGAGADATAKLTIAAKNSDLPQINLLTNLTANDRQFITAATGSVIAADGTVTNPAAGGAAANPSNTSVNPFILQIAGDRLNGSLKGDITPGFFQHLASQDSELGQAIDPNILSAGLQFLQGQNTAKPQTPASTSAS